MSPKEMADTWNKTHPLGMTNPMAWSEKEVAKNKKYFSYCLKGSLLQDEMSEEEYLKYYAKGGKIGFDGLAKKVAKRYEGKSVPKKFQKEYGKTYDREEAMEVGKKVAGKVYREQQKMAKGGMIPFSTSNLYLNGFRKDSNGNSVVKVSFPNSRAFSIQTNGNLPKTHSLKQQNLKIENLSKKDLKIVEKEVNDYVKEFGSDSQIKKLNTYAKGGKTQGYNDKLDESLGNTKGKRSKKTTKL